MKHKHTHISFEDIYGVPIIGYDSDFWKFCKETNKDDISRYAKNDKLRKLSFVCDRGHPFSATPYEFYFSRSHCPICLVGNDIGAAKCDPELEEYYSDSRYLLSEISELSPCLFSFKCPDCGFSFEDIIANLIHKKPKCPKCKIREEKTESTEKCDEYTFLSVK